MTVNQDPCCPPLLSEAVARTPATDQVRKAAFAVLRSGAPARLSDLATSTGQDLSDTRDVLAALVTAGIATVDGDLDGDPLVVGAEGLTTEITPHRLDLGGQVLHTWCAFDTVGIPAALGLDAGVATTCPTCGAVIAIEITAGQVPDSSVMGWWPEVTGGPVNKSFCPTASFFCSADHLDPWRATASPAGEALTLTQLSERGRVTWSLFAPSGTRS